MEQLVHRIYAPMLDVPEGHFVHGWVLGTPLISVPGIHMHASGPYDPTPIVVRSAGHGVHAVCAWLLLNVAIGHDVHAVAPTLADARGMGENVLGEHRVHAAPAPPPEKNPPLHFVHDGDPPVPGEHAHSAAPTAPTLVVFEFAPHDMHCVLPAVSAYVPKGHIVHSVAPATGENEPIAHGVHTAVERGPPLP